MSIDRGFWAGVRDALTGSRARPTLESIRSLRSHLLNTATVARAAYSEFELAVAGKLKSLEEDIARLAGELDVILESDRLDIKKWSHARKEIDKIARRAKGLTDILSNDAGPARERVGDLVRALQALVEVLEGPFH